MGILIISIPLISSLSIIILGRKIGSKGGGIISIGSIGLSGLISIIKIKEYLEGKISIIKIKEWYEIGIIKTNIELIYDKESTIMSVLIGIITIIVIIYSYWYLSEDAHINKFVGYLLLFSVAMFILVSSKNYIVLFLGWELVGIISYLLINYWYTSLNNNKSAIKALLFNKIGDIAFLLGIILLYYSSISGASFTIMPYSSIPDAASSNIITMILICFIIAAMAKSAQILLHNWLGDAMAGPTPVSALLHAATMVTAGIFLLIRIYSGNIIEYTTNLIPTIINIIGTLTIIFAGLSAIYQYDIKKIIAYSTCAQIGYMFFIISIPQVNNGSIYHLLTHGFFKALLFLSAGLIIHSFFVEQDIRKYGNFLYKAPLFYIFFFIGSLAIMGIPPLSGYYSKDLIILHSLELNNIYYYILLIIGSLLSSIYSIKIIYYSFFNSHIKPLTSFSTLSTYKFLFPFILLISGSIFLGYFLSNLLSSPEDINLDLDYLVYSTSNIIYSLFGIIPLYLPFLVIIFFLIYISKKKIQLTKLKRIWIRISNRRFFFDLFYNYLVIKPIFFLSYHFSYKFLDRGYLEYLGPLALFRLFFFFPKYLNISRQLTYNLPYIFFYFFCSILLLFFSFFILS